MNTAKGKITMYISVSSDDNGDVLKDKLLREATNIIYILQKPGIGVRIDGADLEVFEVCITGEG